MDPRGRRATEVTLMADYGRYLWTNSPVLGRLRDHDGNIDPLRLGVSADLIAAMKAWHQEWEEMAYSNVGFPTDEADRAWTRRSWALARRLQDELPDIEVRYQHDARGPLPVRDHFPDGGGPRHRPTVVRLMPDYGGVFLWNMSPERSLSDPYALQPEDLALSDGLTDHLVAWYDTWERGRGRMSRRYSPTSGSGPKAWDSEGLRLAGRLQKELGPDVEVLYRELPITDLLGR
jgi:hypothetical protein